MIIPRVVACSVCLFHLRSLPTNKVLFATLYITNHHDASFFDKVENGEGQPQYLVVHRVIYLYKERRVRNVYLEEDDEGSFLRWNGMK